jgi:hypothetical protein
MEEVGRPLAVGSFPASMRQENWDLSALILHPKAEQPSCAQARSEAHFSELSNRPLFP